MKNDAENFQKAATKLQHYQNNYSLRISVIQVQ